MSSTPTPTTAHPRPGRHRVRIAQRTGKDTTEIRNLLTPTRHTPLPLGVGALLERWGVPVHRIVELDWNESAGLILTATPARHYCAGGPRTGTRQLWASGVVAGTEHKVLHSGGTGYFPGFAEIGAQHGPFGATMMQIGAYSEFWPEVHTTPEEGVRAHGDLGGGAVLLAIHWATFDLAPHAWDEPIERTVAARTSGVTGRRTPPRRALRAS